MRENSEELSDTFPPLTGKRVAMGDVFTSCNWVLRDGSATSSLDTYSRINDRRRAPKTASKRVFLITDEDDPHSGPGSKQLVTSARTTLIVTHIYALCHFTPPQSSPTRISCKQELLSSHSLSVRPRNRSIQPSFTRYAFVQRAYHLTALI